MAKKDWFGTDEWEDTPDAMENFYKRIARCRGKSEFNTRRKGKRLFRADDPVKKAAGLQILRKLIADQEADWDGAVLEREVVAQCFFDSRQFDLAETEYRACQAFLTKHGKLRVGDYDLELGRVLVQSPDASKRQEGEGLLADHFRRIKNPDYPPYEELAARSSYDLPLKQARGKGLIDCTMIEIKYQEADHVIGGLATAISGLDAAMFKEPMIYALQQPFVQETMLPELGAFVGNWAVEFQGAKWDKQTPLVKSRLCFAEERHDPFLWAFKAIYYFYPLERLLEGVPSRR